MERTSRAEHIKTWWALEVQVGHTAPSSPSVWGSPPPTRDAARPDLATWYLVRNLFITVAWDHNGDDGWNGGDSHFVPNGQSEVTAMMYQQAQAVDVLPASQAGKQSERQDGTQDRSGDGA